MIRAVHDNYPGLRFSSMILLEWFGIVLLAEAVFLAYDIECEARRRHRELGFTVRARAHLMRARFRSRLSWAPFASFIVAAVVSVFMYGGWGGFRGIPVERKLRQVLIGFPIFWAYTFAFIMLNPFRSNRWPEP